MERIRDIIRKEVRGIKDEEEQEEKKEQEETASETKTEKNTEETVEVVYEETTQNPKAGNNRQLIHALSKCEYSKYV